jgi:hypothetical protein
MVKNARYCHMCGNMVGTKVMTVTINNIDDMSFLDFKNSVDDICMMFSFQFPSYHAFEKRARECEKLSKIVMTLTGLWGHMMHKTHIHKENNEKLQGQIAQDKRDYLEKCIGTLVKTIDTISRSFTMDTKDMELSGKGSLGRKE